MAVVTADLGADHSHPWWRLAQDLGLDFKRGSELVDGRETGRAAGLEACDGGAGDAAALGELVLGKHAAIAPKKERRRRSQRRTRHPFRQAIRTGRNRDSAETIAARHVPIVHLLCVYCVSIVEKDCGW